MIFGYGSLNEVLIMARNYSNHPIIKRIKRVFHAKNVVIVSQHNVDHYALSFRTQLLLLVILLSVVGAASFSTGRYIEAQQTIAQQDETIETALSDKVRLHNEYVLLKRDLMRMDKEGDELSDYAQFVIEQHQNDEADNVGLSSEDAASANGKVLERLHALEYELKRERFEHKQFIETLHLLAQDHKKLLERAFDMTGMSKEISQILAPARKEFQNMHHAHAASSDAEVGQGGPFHPVDAKLKTEATALSEELVLGEVAYVTEMLDVMEHIPMGTPMNAARITSGFGRRFDPFDQRLANHTGMDFSAAHGSPVRCTGNGRVIYAGYQGAYGYAVDVSHGGGFTTRYGHLSKILVRRGQTIKRNDMIGLQGNSGRSTGSHLHYEVRYRGRPLNPAKFVKAGHYVSKTFQ
ncbi:MAG: M23 family metallopeptidase [Alphaproteobacteria bacterium]|nr:MAG: M23 family metallopeptidase [Alphaproteobacteria bacterium]TAF14883.1 MAG: M23 family metallopeptidase [Alphaproteobacteria bacterium]TAF41432.1 MAG: M23 family metallopeptidase [Alphaproteobacteria bacterium]TAF75399.1 MAG: M23 family metallopeptidase [Alphaproteobacteria bacterium]